MRLADGTRKSTREILSLFFGKLTKYALIWLAAGLIVVYAGQAWKCVGQGWEYVDEEFNRLFAEYGLGFFGGIGLILVLLAIALSYTSSRRETARYVLRNKKKKVSDAVTGIASWIIILLFFGVTVVYQKWLLWLVDFCEALLPQYVQESKFLNESASWCHPELRLWSSTVLTIAVGVIALAGEFLFDLNVFSIQNIYRNRLVRCYLGASKRAGRHENIARFDPEDDLELNQFERQRPFHLISAALNLTKAEDLAWQERKPFCGLTAAPDVAIAVPTITPFDGRPSLPFCSSLTLLNMRLGRWMPNPNFGAQGKRYPWGHYYLQELFFGTNEEDGWVYLSDGGHFENLGIYELVRRRCRRIIAVDAGADPHRDFGDLGGAIHKCRVDFGVDIEINTEKLSIDADGRSESAFAMGRINYPEKEKPSHLSAFEGTLIYIKPSIPKGMDIGEDIHSYRAQHPEFPHEPTTDQWFTESQFESYRYLGYLIGKHAIQHSDI